MKQPAVLFSGGLDSTYVLYDALRHHSQVRVYMLDIVGWPDLMMRQKEACTKILDLFRSSEFSNANSLGTIISTDTVKAYDSVAINRSHLHGFRQAALITKALLEFGSIHDVMSISVGLVKGDNGVPTFKHYQDAWSAIYRVTFPFGKEPPSLDAPAISMTKEDIIAALPNSALRLVEWCGSHQSQYSEEAQGCGRCPSCLTMAKTVAGIKYCNPRLYSQKLKSIAQRYDALIELTNKRNSL